MLNHHLNGLKKDVEKGKKLKQHEVNDSSKPQNYLNGKSVEQARMAFRIRSEMVKDIRGNYKDKYRRSDGEVGLLYQGCPAATVESQIHCLICP